MIVMNAFIDSWWLQRRCDLGADERDCSIFCNDWSHNTCSNGYSGIHDDFGPITNQLLHL